MATVMPPREDLILFLDLEATGADKNVEEIVEVGIIALAAPDWHEVGTYTHVVEPTEEAYQRMVAHDIVREMHATSGLLADIDRYRQHQHGLATIETIDQDVSDWLTGIAGTNTSHIPYGGSGVSHYDRPLIERLMPKLNKRITFWAYDVGNVRRIARLAGRTDWPDQAGKNHRALADARFHVDEFRHALRILAP